MRRPPASRLLRVLPLALAASGTTVRAGGGGPIDRHALVTRHGPAVTAPDPLSPLSVGNGEFAFTADVTGLQTFPAYYAEGIPLGTQSQWGWHTFPNPQGYRLSQATRPYDAHGRQVPYATDTASPAAGWLRANPHRLHLGRIGLAIDRADGTRVSIEDLRAIRQTLDLWSGMLRSRFEVEGARVEVETCCHPRLDMLAVTIGSPLLEKGRLAVELEFPYASGSWGPGMEDWGAPDRHETTVLERDAGRAELARKLDADTYRVTMAWSEGGTLEEAARHRYRLGAPGARRLAFICAFSPGGSGAALPGVEETRAAAAAYWSRFWSEGGAVDLSRSTDPRARELERRIVLSAYLCAIQCAGSRPPQETGLTCNSWHGKSHLEMHWWHGVHFALWGRLPLLERSLGWYSSILPSARETAAQQGYRGARWPKMVGPAGRESPSGVGVFLIWQEPHPIYYAELCYRAHGDRQTLERHKEVVLASAEFMASYAHWDAETDRYALGPPLIPAQECYPASETRNPTFELAYWAWGLSAAQDWRRRLGMEREPAWDHVIEHLSPLPVGEGVYLTAETAQPNRDHPSHLAACGMLPGGPRVDGETMRRTLREVMSSWRWDQTWGWDYPMTAMTAARCGEPGLAIDALLMDSPKNRYLPNGHNFQSGRLPIYLPGNGGLLAAVAMMAAGWDGAPARPAPGFPADGSWVVRWEGLARMP